MIATNKQTKTSDLQQVGAKVAAVGRAGTCLRDNPSPVPSPKALQKVPYCRPLPPPPLHTSSECYLFVCIPTVFVSLNKRLYMNTQRICPPQRTSTSRTVSGLTMSGHRRQKQTRY